MTASSETATALAPGVFVTRMPYNYIASHNGFTLCDVVSYDGKHNEANGENNLDGPDYNYSWNCGAEGNSRKKAVNELRKN